MRIDLFCRVIDNYGDAGVAVRLARRLHRLGASVRLWLDNASLSIGNTEDARLFERRLWPEPFTLEAMGKLPDAVIALFGCRLPETYLSAMADQAAAEKTAPVWLNLEYLSAESWVEQYHGLASPHPTYGLSEYFFFPGFTPATGGLLCEPELRAARDTFTRADRKNLLQPLDINADAGFLLSLFVYPEPNVLAWLEQWPRNAKPIHVVTFPSPLLGQIQSALALPTLQPGDHVQRESLHLHVLPWLTQDDYDRLLWSCDLNIVRGEDSFVRAQLAGQPLLWQPYRQTADTHLTKLDAFLQRYLAGFPERQRRTLRTLHALLNPPESGPVGNPVDWAAALADLTHSDAQAAAAAWRSEQIAYGDLSERLLTFIARKQTL